jgi:uncharacterized protein YbbC (DUF1343 family)
VNVFLLDRTVLDSPELGIELASAMHKLYPEQYHIDRMVELLNNRASFDALVAGQDPRRIAENWQEQLEVFQKVRQKYLIYK